MGIWTTKRGAVAIPGEVETDCLCTAGVVSIVRVCWSQYTVPSPLLLAMCLQKMKRHDSRTHFTRTHQILISPGNEMKWNELYGLQLRMKWNEMKCDWYFIKETWNEVHEMHHFHEISWDFMKQKKGPPNEM
jgi:hypothetical protein